MLRSRAVCVGDFFPAEVMARAPAEKPKGGAGIPVSPFSEPNWARRFDWIPADLV